MLMRKERLKSFAQMWRDANLDYYQTQANKDRVGKTTKTEPATA